MKCFASERSNKIEENFYRATIRPTMTYGVEWWPIGEKQKECSRYGNVEMDMHKTRKDRIRNECIWKYLESINR